MPDDEALEQMYGKDYLQFLSTEESHSGNDGITRVRKQLQKMSSGIFLDYACGGGALLREVSNLGWEVVGIERDAETARKFSELLEIRIISDVEKLAGTFPADVIHFGDVLEHLTDIDNEFPRFLRLVKNDGLVIAQGPLEANFNVFYLGIKLVRYLRGKPPSDMPPYHVALATAKGQRALFNRMRLTEIEFTIFETAHPAPQTLRVKDIRKPRAVGLFLLRKISQAVTNFFPRKMGNRYFYMGTVSK